jgi:uncharacterized membrane protein HdeD (DUF308 family)
MFTFVQPISRGHAALRGLFAAAVGAVLIAWPGITIGTVAVLFAIACFVDAFATGERAFRSGLSGGDRALLAIRAAIEAIAGVVAIAYPGATAAVMTVIVGLSLLTVGGLELTTVGRLSRAGARGLGWPIAGGVLSIIAGITLMVWPGMGAVTLAVLFGVYLLVAGAALVIAAIATPAHRPVIVGA